MTLQYFESYEKATHIAREALPLAKTLELPANPVTYAVLYEYVTQHNPSLNQAFDLIRQQPGGITEARVQALYETYIAQSDKQVMKELRKAVDDLFKTTQGSLIRAHEESKQYQSGLDVGARQLQQSTDQHEWLMIAQRLIEETRQMQSTTETLNQALEMAYSELEQLRNEYQQARNESMCDPLTGVKNRRAFDVAIKEQCEAARKNHQPLSLLMVDIDHFKKINDSFGHVIGDGVLKWVANMINETVRGSDILARYGGEEFAILLPDTVLDGAEHVGGNICRRVSSQRLKHSEMGQSIGRVTVSLGLARYRPGESIEEFIGRADEALYMAKNSGRNRLCKYSMKMDVA